MRSRAWSAAVVLAVLTVVGCSVDDEPADDDAGGGRCADHDAALTLAEDGGLDASPDPVTAGESLVLSLPRGGRLPLNAVHVLSGPDDGCRTYAAERAELGGDWTEGAVESFWHSGETAPELRLRVPDDAVPGPYLACLVVREACATFSVADG